MKTAAILLAPIALAASAVALIPATAAPPPAASNLTWARLGQTVVVSGYRVTPQRIIDDSRCPVDVNCVWAGRLRIAVRIDGPPRPIFREMTLGQPLAVPGGTLNLIEAQPQRRTNALVSPNMYRFGFRFERIRPRRTQPVV